MKNCKGALRRVVNQKVHAFNNNQNALPAMPPEKCFS